MKGFGLIITAHLLFQISFSSSFLVPARAANNETDMAALLSFKSLVASDPFGVLSSWNNSLPHCQWAGVLCGRRHPDRVIALNLSSKALSGQISSSLANLSFLQSLNLSNNMLTGNIPEELGFLPRVHFINLSMNYLDGNIPFALGNSSRLQFLSMRSNDLRGIIPSNLARCQYLQVLDLRSNSLVGGIPPEFGFLSQLNLLYLSSNNLTGSIPHTLGNLTNLSILDLYNNYLHDSIPISIGKLHYLRFLTLGFNNLSGEVPHSLYNISALVGMVTILKDIFLLTCVHTFLTYNFYWHMGINSKGKFQHPYPIVQNWHILDLTLTISQEYLLA